MTTSETKPNVKDRLFNKEPVVQHRPDAIEPWDKDTLRAQLAKDVDRWLAQGNEITKAPDAQDDRNCRRVEVHVSGYYF